jgi:bacterioferritin
MLNDTDTQRAVELLNHIMELELAGVVRYTHYSLRGNSL